jgi:hypothetical protein
MKGPTIFRYNPLALDVSINNSSRVTIISVYKTFGVTVVLMKFDVFWNVGQAESLQGTKFLWWIRLGPTKVGEISPYDTVSRLRTL